MLSSHRSGVDTLGGKDSGSQQLETGTQGSACTPTLFTPPSVLSTIADYGPRLLPHLKSSLTQYLGRENVVFNFR